MNHKQKVKLARKMRSKLEIKERVPIFQTNFWERRIVLIKNNVAKRNYIKQQMKKAYGKTNNGTKE